jgi:hypothetical protein
VEDSLLSKKRNAERCFVEVSMFGREETPTSISGGRFIKQLLEPISKQKPIYD